MLKSTFDVPMMYGDHHVLEVRKLLLAMPGVTAVYASSSFHIVEVEFDDKEVSGEIIREKLAKAGYLGDLVLPTESGTAGSEKNGQKPFFRQTAVLEQVSEGVSFGQKVPFQGRPLWPCPGIGTIPEED